ncbi:MAG: DUF4230 domain-containing protein [Anaerolineae bacterium]
MEKDRWAQVFVMVLVMAVLAVSVLAVRFVLQRLSAPDLTVDVPVELLPRPNPTPTIYPSTVTVIESVRDLSRLETASYVMEKVITAESGQGPLGFIFGDRLLLIAYGEVIAGVDLTDFGADNLVWGEAGTLYVRLPPAEVLVTTLDNERTQVYDRRTGLVGLNPQLESEARQEAERLIEETAVAEGILERATRNAEEFLRSLLLGLGVKEVVFVEVLPTPTPLPDPTSVAE